MQFSLDMPNASLARAEEPSARRLLRHALVLAGLFVLLSAVYWIAIYAIAGKPGMPLDDSFIHLQYARSIYEGHPFEYNPGVRSSGTSAPLWTAMLPLTYVLTRNWLGASYLLGVLWTIPCVGLVYWLVLRWTQRQAWAFFAGWLFVLANPTVISAYGGMEVPAYVAMFLLGLLFYDFGRTAPAGRQTRWRLAASAVFAVGVWLRPEFLLMPVLIGLERLVWQRQEGSGWAVRWLREMLGHAAVWAVLLVPYMAFNHWAAGELLPNTYTIKAVARNSTKEVREMAGLPAIWMHHDWAGIGRLLGRWVPFMALSTVLGLLANNAVLAWMMPRATSLKKAKAMAGPAGLLAALSLTIFPLARVLVDPIGTFDFQFQRYFGHLTALLVLLGVAALAVRSGAAMPGRRLMVAAGVFGLLGLLGRGWHPVLATRNINDMQVAIGQWIDKNTPPDAVVATNDVGAIAFYGHRRIIDTVGLTEPDLAKWYLAGGDLEGYLKLRKPTYACLFPEWHDRLADRPDLFQPLWKVDFKHVALTRKNVICGGDIMLVLRTCWDKQFDPAWQARQIAEAKARTERIARRAAARAATMPLRDRGKGA